MVWQRAGTVAVQNGSSTVIGTNVDFAASSRIGDSFVGPDGATYELANVASSTVISILPAYKGATVSGAAYAIMPVQGYDKMLSDAFNSLNNQFGLKLAALGTTGNYEILPIEKGGTGAQSKLSAQAALEIPTTTALLSVNKGGTGASSAAAARLALGVDVTLATAVLDPQTAGGLMSSTVVSGWTVSKYANGEIILVSPFDSLTSFAANELRVVDVTIPFTLISSKPSIGLATLTPASVYDFTVPSTWMPGPTSVRFAVKNGGTAQTFNRSIMVKGMWK